MKVVSLPTPLPSPLGYLIAIHATATNFYDLLQIQGKYQHQPPLPFVSGSEFAGTVLAQPSSPSPIGMLLKGLLVVPLEYSLLEFRDTLLSCDEWKERHV